MNFVTMKRIQVTLKNNQSTNPLHQLLDPNHLWLALAIKTNALSRWHFTHLVAITDVCYIKREKEKSLNDNMYVTQITWRLGCHPFRAVVALGRTITHISKRRELLWRLYFFRHSASQHDCLKSQSVCALIRFMYCFWHLILFPFATWRRDEDYVFFPLFYFHVQCLVARDLLWDGNSVRLLWCLHRWVLIPKQM